MDTDSKVIIDTLNVILAKMATKDEIAGLATKRDLQELRLEMNEGFASLRSEIRDIRHEIREIHERLDAIEAELKHHCGYAKEIDHLLERVTEIEKHLGIEHKIAV